MTDLGSATVPGARLEYVVTEGCSDCVTFEALWAHLRPDYPEVTSALVPADSPRGIALSVGRGIMRFPIIVLDDRVVGIERIDEAGLRAALRDRAEARP
ncbi:MAG: hypothetical protein M0Z49_00370 [Chloroflexi bacterium]|nr:hypothetical protein [Chloroflexota bacterium]